MMPSIFRALNVSPIVKVITGTTTIGSGTVRDYAMPIYGEFWPQTLSANIYTKSDLSKNSAGEKYMVGLEIGLYEYAADYQFDYIQIALAHITESEFPNPFTPQMEIELRDLTWVHRQAPFIPNKDGEGNTSVYFDLTNFDTDSFIYNGEDNLLVIFIGGFYKDAEPGEQIIFPRDYGYTYSSQTYRRASLLTQSSGDVEVDEWFAVRQLQMNATFYHYRYREKRELPVMPFARSFENNKYTIKRLMEEASQHSWS